MHSVILLFFHDASIKSFSKHKNIFGSIMFGSDLGAPRIVRDMIVEIRKKFKTIEVPLDSLDNVFCDNNGVVKNTSIPESTLSNKHNAINYHCVHEAVVAGILRVRK